jgi:hypothetical protein
MAHRAAGRLDRMKRMAISYGELVKKPAAVRAALSSAPA